MPDRDRPPKIHYLKHHHKTVLCSATGFTKIHFFPEIYYLIDVVDTPFTVGNFLVIFSIFRGTF